MIRPTVGRVVWYRPGRYDADGPAGLLIRDGQPLAAFVAYVWHDRMVNIAGWDHDGRPFTRTSVFLCQDDDVVPAGHSHAQWMPFQLGQAKKHEAAESLAAQSAP